VFWVISVYFSIRNTLPKSGTFLLGHPVYHVISKLRRRLSLDAPHFQKRSFREENSARKYISLPLKYNNFERGPLFFKENYVLETLERVKNISSYLRRTLIFSSEKCENRVLLYIGSVCSRTQLCHIGLFNDYIKQLHVSAFSGHLQVVLREQT